MSKNISSRRRPLRERNIPIYPFNADNIQEGMTVIAGNAFPDDHPELVRAREIGVEVIRYHKFLGEYIGNYTSIAITGAHGKTSTTGLMAHVVGGYKPTSYLIGDGTGAGHENADFFVMEACEYRRHFLAYSPDYAVMTNIDFDHPDYFANIEDVYSAFQSLAMQVKKAIIACGDDSDFNVFKRKYLLCIMALVLKMILKRAMLKKQQKVQNLMFLFAMNFIALSLSHYLGIMRC